MTKKKKKLKKRKASCRMILQIPIISLENENSSSHSILKEIKIRAKTLRLLGAFKSSLT